MALLITVMMVALLVPQSKAANLVPSWCLISNPALITETGLAFRSASKSTRFCPDYLPHPGTCVDFEWSKVMVPKVLGDVGITDGATISALKVLYMGCAKNGQNMCSTGTYDLDLACWIAKAEKAVS